MEAITYTHIVKIDSTDAEGILDNDYVSVTAKMDGTNGRVWLEDGKIVCGSRGRKITVEKDNAGFAAFVHGYSDEAKKLWMFLNGSPQYEVFGEWMGQNKFIGSTKYYDEEAKGKFFIFDVYDRENQRYLFDSEWRPMLALYGLSEYFVHLFGVYSHPTLGDIQKIADENKFMISSPDKVGEGVVIKAKGFTNKYGNHVYAKLIHDDYLRNKQRKEKEPINPGEIEQSIIAIYVTDAEMAKAVSKTCVWAEVDEFNKKSGKMIGFFLNMVYRESLLEEMPQIISKLKDPTVDFKLLHQMCNAKCRKYLGF
jgi:hypothetical protein